MTQPTLAGTLKTLLSLTFALPIFGGTLFAQGSGGPLTIQGLHQHDNHSAAARSFGGVTVGRQGDVGLMFLNPASMHSLNGIQVSLGGLRQYRDLSQEQNFAPVRYYPNLSLLLENRTGSIPDPDPDLVGFTPADSVQRPFDDIQPRWSRSNTSSLPLHALVAVPFSLGGISITAGAGAVQYANLDHYYQNNNALSPEVLSPRPLPILRPTDNNPVTADWYQSVRSREGEMRGYGGAVAVHIERYDLALGFSGLLLSGTSDDFEQDVQRGRLTFLANEFRADSTFSVLTRTGTSDFSGQEFTFSSVLNSQYATLGVVVKAPMKVTRSFRTSVVTDTTGAPVSSSISGEDHLQLPWRGSVGLLLRPREQLHIGLQYEFRPYSSATYTDSRQAESEPWQSASPFRVGAEYHFSPWLVIRGGISGEADVFVADGSAIEDEPVSYRVFSAGFGLTFSGVQWNLSYENARMKYEDIWGSALSRNSDDRHTITTAISYTIPMGR